MKRPRLERVADAFFFGHVFNYGNPRLFAKENGPHYAA
jgi:hypothetical protein